MPSVVEHDKNLARVDRQPDSNIALPHQPTSLASATVPPADNAVLMFERLLKDPTVDVDKLERLIAMQERIQARNARADFYADFALMQGELPTVAERGRTNNGRYATHEDIVEAVRPVLQKYGFILTFRTKFEDKLVRVVGVLAHRSGHAEETEFMSQPDASGNKNAIQALGSAVSYGQRYTARALLNIASREDDDDGRRANSKPAAPSPEGYEKWLEAAEDVAAEGWEAYAKFWNDPKGKACRKYLVETDSARANRLQLKAKGVR